MTGGHQSHDRAHLAGLQRKRRARMVRIDYMPGDAALAAIEAKRATVRAGTVDATNSALIDAIVTEWAELAGIKCREVDPPKSPGTVAELADMYAQARMTSGRQFPVLQRERSARAQESGGLPGITAHIAGARAGAYESGALSQYLAEQERRQATRRVVCGAKRHRDGQPCQAKSEPGKRRCRFHGGRSTGPTSDAGKARALANLRQYRKP